MPQLHRLEGFYWVVTAGGYARAARAFPYPITQPAVHQQVKKLEAELGMELLERTGKESFRLTPAGRALYDFAAPFFEGLPPLVRALRSGTPWGTLTIHAEPIVLRHLLPRWLRRIHRRMTEGARVDLRELAAPDVGPLRSGEADLIVAYLTDVPDDIETRRVGTLHPFLVLPSSWKDAVGQFPSLEQLDGRTFISYTPGSLPYQLQIAALEEKGLRPEHTLHTHSADTILGFVEAGLGFSLVPSLEPEGPRGGDIRAFALTLDGRQFPVIAAWRRRGAPHPLLDLALEAAPSAAP